MSNLLLSLFFGRSKLLIIWGIAPIMFLSACFQAIDSVENLSDPADEDACELEASTGERYANYEIITVLPRDAILAIA